MIFKIDNQEINWEPDRLLIAGYTSQDQEALKKHIKELEEIGVQPPPRIPMIYDMSRKLLTNDGYIEVVREESSGEAEVVLLDIEGKWYMGVGSDHTDRRLETVSVQKSKQVCGKPVSRELWPLDRVKGHWDQIEMKSWVTDGDREILYQSGKLKDFMVPDDLLKVVKERGYSDTGLALFCGTFSLLSDGFIYGKSFRAELYDPIHDQKIELAYDINILTDAEEV